MPNPESVPGHYEELIETPSIEVVTAIGKIACNWTNSLLMRYEVGYEDHLVYNDGDSLHQLNVLDEDWDKLVEAHYPWEWWPDLSRFDDSEYIGVKLQGNRYEFRPRNTTIRMFLDHSFDHVEHAPTADTLRGMNVTSEVYKQMMRWGFPIKFLPYVDRASREWFEKTRKK